MSLSLRVFFAQEFRFGPDSPVAGHWADTTQNYRHLLGSSEDTGTEAGLATPEAITSNPDHYLYVAGTRNATIRRVTPPGTVTTIAGETGERGSSNGCEKSSADDIEPFVPADHLRQLPNLNVERLLSGLPYDSFGSPVPVQFRLTDA